MCRASDLATNYFLIYFLVFKNVLYGFTLLQVQQTTMMQKNVQNNRIKHKTMQWMLHFRKSESISRYLN